ncbi:MAG: 30S ribosomal protein S4e [Candidatus Aenigmatarchaeota archaeon]|nr:30S ribosomal protein S4e [Candidatus Aenigmarchaeota archaeon]
MTRHMKTFSAPKSWKIPAKSRPWVVKPSPGPHKKSESIPLAVIIRDILKIADTYKEAKTIINKGNVLVDGVVRKNPKFSPGLMDVISIPSINKNFRIVVSKDGLKIIEIAKNEVNLKLCRVNRKKIVKGKKIQLGTHDGRTFVVKEKDYSTGDSLLVQIPEQKIIEHLKMEKGTIGLITGGENRGEIVKINQVKTTRSREPNKVSCNLKDREIDAVKDDVFVVGTNKPKIQLE